LEAVKEARLWHNSGEVRQLAAVDAKTQRLLKGQCTQHWVVIMGQCPEVASFLEPIETQETAYASFYARNSKKQY
jgi:hypothetical protein